MTGTKTKDGRITDTAAICFASAACYRLITGLVERERELRARLELTGSRFRPDPRHYARCAGGSTAGR